MKNPMVSVLIPAYRCTDTIRDAIESVLCQQIPLELLVIDDCSEDDLRNVLLPYMDDPRVTVVRNERNLGVAESRNRGVAIAKGKYIAFLDADDVWAPEKLRKQVACIEKHGMVLCATARELMTQEGKLTGCVIPVKEIISYRELLKHNSINCSSVLMRTDVAREFPMHHEDSHEDYIMWLEVLRKYGSACAVNEPLLKYRLSSKGKSGSKLKSAKMTFSVYRYMGFSLIKSLGLFASYAVHGVTKYVLSVLGDR